MILIQNSTNHSSHLNHSNENVFFYTISSLNPAYESSQTNPKSTRVLIENITKSREISENKGHMIVYQSLVTDCNRVCLNHTIVSPSRVTN